VSVRVTELSNPDLFLYVLWTLGATGKHVDIEDAVAEAYRIAPSKFAWRTRAIPSDRAGAQALLDIGKQHGKEFVMASKDRNLQLSSDAVAWVQANLDRLKAAVEDGVLAGAERPSQRPLVELESVEWVRSYAEGEDVDAGRVTFAHVLHLTPDASPRAWRERVATLRSAAQRSGRSRLSAFFERLEAEHPDWFGGQP